MATTEQFSLRWNNFHSNMTSGFHDLLEAAEMVDVTLAVDGHFLQAHKIVLSICSPYFKQMFKVNPCKHPIVILRDVGHENMKDILEFMYMGEVSVLRENLTQFLRVAELLQVKGLTGDDSSEDASSTKEAKTEYDNEVEDNEMYSELIESDVELPKYTHSPPAQCSSTATKRTKTATNGSSNVKRTQAESYQTPSKLIKSEFDKSDPTLNNNNTSQKNPNNECSNILKTNTELEDNKEPINLKTMWNFNTSSSPEFINTSDQGKPEKHPIKNQYQCGQCKKKFSRRDHLRTHEKNIHGEFAGPFKCVICSQLYKNTESLRKHIAKFHFSTINETIQRIEVNA